MKFSSKEDVEVPIEQTFEMLNDFEGFERAVLRRGGEVRRKGAIDPPTIGMGWLVGFRYRGRQREVDVTLSDYERPNVLAFSFEGSGIRGEFKLELVALSRRRTRLGLWLEIKPETLSARLLIQSLKLGKSTLDKRFKLRVADYAKDLEDRHARTARA